MGTISIPKSYMGYTLQEATVKAALLQMNPDLHFDMGACLGLWHPFMSTRQNVFYRGRSICAMDRGTLPEVPVWSTRRELVEVPAEEVKPGEIAMYSVAGVNLLCHKCAHVWTLPTRPVGVVICPTLCENMGSASDATLFQITDRPTMKAQVWRSVRDRVILVGWRHTFRQLIRAMLPGVTQRGLELAFAVDLSPHLLDPVEVIEGGAEERTLDQRVQLVSA